MDSRKTMIRLGARVCVKVNKNVPKRKRSQDHGSKYLSDTFPIANGLTQGDV